MDGVRRRWDRLILNASPAGKSRGSLAVGDLDGNVRLCLGSVEE
jgi:hypothetical protein